MTSSAHAVAALLEFRAGMACIKSLINRLSRREMRNTHMAHMRPPAFSATANDLTFQKIIEDRPRFHEFPPH